jgi:hypothetical protein
MHRQSMPRVIVRLIIGTKRRFHKGASKRMRCQRKGRPNPNKADFVMEGMTPKMRGMEKRIKSHKVTAERLIIRLYFCLVLRMIKDGQ